MLKIENLNKSFDQTDDVQLLENLCLEVPAGSSVSIQGASGCGKSTLLSLIAGFDFPDSGNIFVDGTSLSNTADLDSFRKNQLGIVFQSFNLFDCFNVWDNIAFTARLKGNYNKAYQQELMHSLGIYGLATKPVSVLSGGEQQRCAIARALIHKPSLVLADEPTGNLDESNSDAVASLLYETCLRTNTSLVLVTHSNQVAQQANTSFLLKRGKLEEITNLHKRSITTGTHNHLLCN